jgi:hypothetical protein
MVRDRLIADVTQHREMISIFRVGPDSCIVQL